MQNRFPLLAALVLLLLSFTPVGAKDLDIIDRWTGTIGDAAKSSLPDPLAIRDKFAWDDLWKATHPDDPEGISPPAVDFESDMVLIGIVPGPNRPTVNKLTLDDKGNVDVAAAGTKVGGSGFGFIYLRVAKDGIKSVNGKPLTSSLKVKRDKAGVRTDAEMNLAGTAVRAITNAQEFGSQWRSTAGDADKPWEVDFAKELVLIVRSSRNSVKVDDVTLDTNGDVKVLTQTTAMPAAVGAPAIGFGYAILLVDREGIASVDGKPLTPATQPKPATTPAK